MDTAPPLRLAIEGATAVITLDRPRALNALNADMADAMLRALDTVRADPAVRAVVLHGAGGAFCAGGDMRDTHAAGGARSADAATAGMARFRRLTQALHELDRPLIAAADGVAYGAGFSLLLLADIVLLGDGARLCMAFQRVGLLPDCGALYTLPRSVGLQRAKELVFSGREIGAQEAQRIGIAMEVLPPEALLPRAMALAHAFAGASPTALSLAKRALDASLHSDLGTVLALEAAGQGVALSSAYVAEAARRFAEREAPQFRWPDAPAA